MSSDDEAVDKIEPVTELLAAVEAASGQLSAHDADRLRYWAQRVAGMVAHGPITDRIMGDSEALARHGMEQELDVPGETRN